MAKAQGKSKVHRGATPLKAGESRFSVVLSGFGSSSMHWVIFIVIVTMLAVALLQAPKFLQRFPIEEIEVDGVLQFVDRAALSRVVSSHTDASKNINYFTVDLAELRRDAQALPWVETVDIRKVWPNKLQLKIEERVAIAIWQNTQLISHKGDLFRPERVPKTTALPKLYGPNDKARFVMDNYHQMSRVLRATQLGITELKLADRLAWTLKLNNQIEVKIDKDQSVEKLLRFVDLYTQFQENKLNTSESKIAKVDLRYSNGIAVTWDDV